ncbi:MAG TPA: permease prefix domain 1-containing protein, partial [Bryobacteraceae bacterium]|nr:permease prefix domain 1-containing protein [Bryobacteraceae bacterium]
MDRMRFFLSRLRALLSRRRYEQDLNDELRFHLEEDAEQRATEGLSPKEALNAAHRQFGNAGRIAEDTRAVWTWTWAERWAQDVRYGWRQILKAKVTSAAAVLSLALALGACLAAFQLVDALLLRPLPVLGADRLFVQVRQGTGFDGKPFAFDGCEYPLFTRYRTALQGKAELVGVSYAARTDLTYSSLQEMEKAQVQYVSGGLFHIFGLQPALGRVLSEADDLTPGAHPQAVIS